MGVWPERQEAWTTATGRERLLEDSARGHFRGLIGNFARWHIKAGVNQYETSYANQFAMYQRAEGAPGVAQVLVTDHPEHGELST